MTRPKKQISSSNFPLLHLVLVLFALGGVSRAEEPFPGAKTDYHGVTLHTVTVSGEKASVLVPNRAGLGRPWFLGASLYSASSASVAFMARTQIELVKRGFHVVVLPLGNAFGEPQATAKWNGLYQEMTAKYGLSQKVSLMGISEEGLSIARWAAENPAKVSCLYMDKAVWGFESRPGGRHDAGKGSPADLAAKLAPHHVAVVYVAGAKDDIVPVAENGAPMQAEYQKLGGIFKMILRENEGHHPHGLEDLAPVVDFLHYRTFGNPEPTVKGAAYGPHPKQVVDFWKAPSDAPTPLAVYIHGGGWMGGDRFSLTPIQPLLKAGISVASVGYRLISEADGVTPPVQAPLGDAARALQFLRSKAGEWNFRKDRVGSWGGSAGGCSILWLAFHKEMADPENADPVARESTRLLCAAVVGAQTSLDPVQMREWTPNIGYGGHAFGFKSFASFLENRAKIQPWIAEYSPYALADSTAPPIYLRYASAPDIGKEFKDPTHSANFGVKMHERLRELGVESELDFPGATEPRHRSGFEFLIDKLNAP
ncbi:MAG: hypothetical protein RLZZ244_2342 [Verrucomicrobiota bacterium]